MTFSWTVISGKIINFGDKTKKYADVIYLGALLIYLTSQALFYALTYAVFIYKALTYISTAFLLLNAIYRLVVVFPKSLKKGLLGIGVLILGFAISVLSGITEFPLIAFAIVGAIGFSGDKILLVSLISNCFMIVSNIFHSFSNNLGEYEYTNNDFFYLGKDSFYFHKFNNRSSTDMAAHYFWMTAAYLLFRGNKLTWGEICALWGLNVLVYSLTGANTTLVCISLLLVIAMANKICMSFKEKGIKAGSLLKVASGFLSFCAKYAFVIFAALSIVLSIVYSTGSPLMYKLNVLLHQRLSLGHRSLVENGVHLFNPSIRLYGGYASAEGFFNFIDCSYISILVRFGIVPFLFYIVSMTAVQIRQKKFIYGTLILAVCALSCIEEHHLIEIPYNVFILLLFADLESDKKLLPEDNKKQVKINKISVVSLALCFAFIGGVVFVNYPRIKSARDLDRLDCKAGEIYKCIQSNIDKNINEGSWERITSGMNSYQYGDVMDMPWGYVISTGTNWDDDIKDRKAHSFYSAYYCAADSSEYLEIFDLMLSDEVKELIGSGSAVIEYDVITGRLYSVWYCEEPGCYSFDEGRSYDRSERLRMTDGVEGYYEGGING